ncbi:Gfo/Idh/MocA family protein [Tannockella kyphosi]|uniref:Gfo/Idh/MocA family protein n=1 Tax=Tannockella kyphosi TaxID=2899121 RepID=UPI0020135F81|nr:Gfo/Idh/MocA family oxidoreductase [Tannockella kyphosi]
MIRWGVIGAGNIAHRFCEALKSQKDSELYAVSCRSEQKAFAFQEEFPCKKAYGTFQAIIDDEKIDAVYVALPHMYHYEWVIKALVAKKAVICEKPAMMSSEQMKKVKEVAIENNTFFMEAMKSRVVPLYRELVKRVDEIGEIQKVITSFCNISEYQENAYHYQPVQGGCLLDLGIYNTAFLVDFLQGDYTMEVNDVTFYENGIELYIYATMTYSNGTVGILETAFDRKKENFVVLEGTKGKIVIPLLHRPEMMEIHKDGNIEIVEKKYEIDDFYSQIDHSCTCIASGKIESEINTFDRSIRAIEIIENINALIR